MRYLTYMSLLAALATVLAACGGGGGGSVPSDAVAKVDGTNITQAQFNALIDQAKRSYKTQKRAFPKAGTTEYGTLKNQAVAYLVQREEFAQQADKLGVTVSDNDVNKRLDQIKKQYFSNSETKYKQQLAQQGLTDAQVKSDIRASLISEGLFKKVTGKVDVSDSDIKSYYDQHLSQYSVPEQRTVAHILVKTKALADRLYTQIQGGANFASLAKKYSQDPGSKSLGGKLTISKGQTVGPFDQTAFLLSTGQVSHPVKTQFGYHIIKALSDIKPAKTTPLSGDVKKSIKQQLEQQKKNDAMTAWTTNLQKNYNKKISYQTGYAPPATTTAAAATTG
jgi:foldase protein PrsA